jgi:diadenylate cyclase
MSFVQQILHQIQVVFQQVGWKELIDVAVVSLIVYQLLRLVRGTQAIQLIVGLVLLAILGIGANALNLLLLSWLFQNAAPFIVIGILVLFQPELRRILDQVGRIGHLGNLRSPLWAFNPTMLTRSIGEASRAAERLAARRTGAIIAFEREVGLEDYAATGVRINGDVSTEFLQTIFFTNSPLHDGAVIIRGDKILAAGCLLPLPEEGSVRERLGTRHRAAIGLIIVVSEETGAISVVENGKITRGLDSEGLRQRLTGSLPTLRPVGTRPLLGWLK